MTHLVPALYERNLLRNAQLVSFINARFENCKTYTGSHLDEGFLIVYLKPEEYFKFIGDLQGLSDGDIMERLYITGTGSVFYGLSK